MTQRVSTNIGNYIRDETITIENLTIDKLFNRLTLQQYNERIYWGTVVRFGQDFNHPIIIAPNITHLYFGHFFNQKLGLICAHVEHITLGENHNFPIGKLPRTLKCIVFGMNYNSPLELPKNIMSVKVGQCFSHPLKLTKKLLHVATGYKFNKPVKPSKYLKTLNFAHNYNKHIELPKYLVCLKMCVPVGKPIILTPYIAHIDIYMSESDMCTTFIFEYTHAVIRLHREHFIDWECCELTNNVKCNILRCNYIWGPLSNAPSNVTIDDK